MQLKSPEVPLVSRLVRQTLKWYGQDLSLQLSLSPSFVSSFPWRTPLEASSLVFQASNCPARQSPSKENSSAWIVTARVLGLPLIGPSYATWASISQSLWLGGLEHADWTSLRHMTTPTGTRGWQCGDTSRGKRCAWQGTSGWPSEVGPGKDGRGQRTWCLVVLNNWFFSSRYSEDREQPI